MSPIDWIVLFGTLISIVGYGAWKTRGSKNLEGYLLGNKEMQWWTIGLSIMATQASAITFLSTPGLGYESGLQFLQFYLGLPIAMVLLSVTFVPLYYKLKVYTAYEFLESRFDVKNRLLAAILFLVQRGLAAGLTIFAPAIILSSVLGLNLAFTNIMVGVLVIIYTVSGGTRAVALTQKLQMGVIMLGMFLAFFILIWKLPENLTFFKAVDLAGSMGKMKGLDFSFDLRDRYNVFTAFTAGIFLFMSYFGTDQSQVARYLGGKSIKESRTGLMFNGLLKVPMQFFILMIGIMVFVFYQFEKPPLYFNNVAWEQLESTEWEAKRNLQDEYDDVFEIKRSAALAFTDNPSEANRKTLLKQNTREKELRSQARDLVNKHSAKKVKDTNYIFISFIMKYLPTGLVGLLLAVIFSASMSSTSSELNALSSTTTIDIYKRIFKKDGSDEHYLKASKVFTLMWGLIAISFALVAHLADNLVELVNIIGSIFYGTILGIFVVAFYLKSISGNAVFRAAIIAQISVIVIFLTVDIAYLWLNLIGCSIVVLLAMLFEVGMEKTRPIEN